MRARQRIYPCVYVYLLTQRELDQSSPHDAAPGSFIASAHVLGDVIAQRHDVGLWRDALM